MYAQDGQSRNELSDNKSWCRDSNALNWNLPKDVESEQTNGWKQMDQSVPFVGKQTWAQVLNAGRQSDCGVNMTPFVKSTESNSKTKNNTSQNKSMNFPNSSPGQAHNYSKRCSNGCSNGVDIFPIDSEHSNNENVFINKTKTELTESNADNALVSNFSDQLYKANNPPCSVLKPPKGDDSRTSSDPSNEFPVPGPKIITSGGWGEETFENIKSDLEVGTSVWGDPSSQMQHAVRRWVNGNKSRRHIKANVAEFNDENANVVSTGWTQSSSTVKNYVSQARENKKWPKVVTPGEEWLCEGHVDTSDWGLITPKTDFDPTEGTIDTSDWGLNNTSKKWENTAQWNINKACDDFGNRNERKQQCYENDLYPRQALFTNKEEYSANDQCQLKMHPLYRTSNHACEIQSSNRSPSINSKTSVVSTGLYIPRFSHPIRSNALSRTSGAVISTSTSNCSQLHHQIMQQYRLAVQAGLLPPDLLDFRLPHFILKYLQQLFELQQRLQQAVISFNERSKGRNTRFFCQAETEALSKSISCFKMSILNLCRLILQAHDHLKRQIAQRHQENTNSSVSDISDPLIRSFKSLQIEKPKLWGYTPTEVKQSQQQAVVYSMPVNTNSFRVTSPYWSSSNSDITVWNDSALIEHSGVLENHIANTLCTNDNANEGNFGSGFIWPSQNTCVLLRNLDDLDYAKLYASSEKHGHVRSLKIFQSHKVALIHYEESQEALNASMFFEKGGLKSAVIADTDVSILERMMIEDTKKGSNFNSDPIYSTSGNSILPNPVGCERYMTNTVTDFQKPANRSIEVDERNFGTFLIENHMISNCI